MHFSSFYTCEVKGKSLRFELYSHNLKKKKEKKGRKEEREERWEEGAGNRTEREEGEAGRKGTEEDDYESKSIHYFVETKLKLDNFFLRFT